jgi:hypothetical protein
MPITNRKVRSACALAPRMVTVADEPEPAARVAEATEAATSSLIEATLDAPAIERPTPARDTQQPDQDEATSLQELIDSDQSEDGKLDLVLQFARDGYDQIRREIRDYTCTLVKRERVEGRLHGYQRIAVKIRHEQQTDDEVTTPFSVFLQFLSPESVAGREVLFVRDQNNGDLAARRGGRRNPNLSVWLDPVGPLAMADNRYPITEIGIANLTKRLIEVVEEEREYNDGEVRIFRNAKLEGRPCIHIQMTHHTRRPNLRYHKARVFVDNELKIPVYFASFDWPTQEGGKPRLLEEYAYLNMKLNVGLTDADFDVNNPEYHFQLDPLGESTTVEQPQSNETSSQQAERSSDQGD